MAVLFSCDASTVSRWVNAVLEYIHETADNLIRLRNLSGPNGTFRNLRDVYREVHQRTLTHLRCHATLKQKVQTFLRNNPGWVSPTNPNLTEPYDHMIIWDSNLIRAMKSNDFNFQRRSHAGKINSNALLDVSFQCSTCLLYTSPSPRD